MRVCFALFALAALLVGCVTETDVQQELLRAGYENPVAEKEWIKRECPGEHSSEYSFKATFDGQRVQGTACCESDWGAIYCFVRED